MSLATYLCNDVSNTQLPIFRLPRQATHHKNVEKIVYHSLVKTFICKITICLNLTLDATDRVGGGAVTLRVVAKLLGFDEGTVFNNDFQGYEVMGNAFSF